jgi:hypothetical protein
MSPKEMFHLVHFSAHTAYKYFFGDYILSSCQSKVLTLAFRCLPQQDLLRLSLSERCHQQDYLDLRGKKLQAATENCVMKNVTIYKHHELLSRIEIDEVCRDGRVEKYYTVIGKPENVNERFKIKSVLK